RSLAGTRPLNSQIGSSLHRTDVHAVYLDARNIERKTALREISFSGGARNRCAHGIAVVLDDVDYRQLPQRCHVEAFVDLPLIGSPVAEIGQRYIVVVAVAIRKRQTGAERNLCTNDAVTAVKMLLFGEHVHGAALALGKAAAAPGQFGHDA